MAIQQVMIAQAMSSGPAPSSYRYWRLYVTSNGGSSYVSVNELELRPFPGGPDLTDPGLAPTRAAASTDYFGANGSNAFDGSTSDSAAWVSSGGVGPQWLRWDFGAGSPSAVAEIAIWPESTESYTRAPVDFEIQGSNNGSSWITVKSYANVIGWSAYGAGGGGYRTFSTT